MDDGTKWVVFVDALDPNRDLDRTDFLASNQQAEMDSTPPRVTPRVMSSIYTGLDPAENGMMRTQMFGQPDQTRPAQTTFIERAMANDLDVLNLYMPFCIPFNNFQGSAGIGTSMGGDQQAQPQQAVPHLTVPGPSGDLVGDERHDIVFDHFVDYTTQLFSTARTLAPEYDVVFIGFRLIDSYCHFQYDTNENGRGAGQGNRYRDKLAEVVDIQLQQLLPRGDVLVFSDHGAEPKTKTFYINKWLEQAGYLSYTIDESFIDDAKEYGVIPGEQHPVEQRIENQITIGQPGVTLNQDETQAISADPFDSCITVLDESITDDLIDRLSKLNAYDGVYHRSELFDEDGKYFEQTPHVIPNRANGVFVSGSVHPDPIGMGWYRTGVHSPTGYIGSNVDLGLTDDAYTPEQTNAIIEDFLDLDRNVNPVPSATQDLLDVEQEAILDSWETQ